MGCPIREELYSQCFDELIRQVTTICAYQSLYESSIAFGMRKALQAEQRRNQHNKRMKDLMVANRKLREEVEDLETKISQIEQNEAERREQEERKHKEEVELLKKLNASRKEQLETLLQAPKK